MNGLNEVYANVYRGLGNKELVKGGGGNPYPKRLYPNGYPDTFPYNTIPSENYYTYKGGRALDGYKKLVLLDLSRMLAGLVPM